MCEITVVDFIGVIEAEVGARVETSVGWEKKLAFVAYNQGTIVNE